MIKHLAAQLIFIIPASTGAFIFLFPVVSIDKQTIVFGILTDFFHLHLGRMLDELLLLIVAIAAVGGIVSTLRSQKSPPHTLFSEAFDLSFGWLSLRIAGFVVVACVYLDIGPEIIRLPDTGITVVKDIGLNIVVIYLVGLALMPLMTDYGLMEFVGAYCKPFFRKLFNLPGRAAVDTLTSVVSASSIGLLVTISQYEKGRYNAREASIIASNFSIVSIPFALVIASITNIDHIFFGWYFTVIISSLMAAVVMSRIPPLALIPETRLAPLNEEADSTGWTFAYQSALAQAKRAPGPVLYVRLFIRNFIVTAFGVLGPCMAIATLASIILFHTPVINWLVTPITMMLTLFSVIEAELIAPGLVAGFGDQFLPALVATKIQAEFWRFIVAGLSVTQLIFMSEFGMLVLRSSLPINFTSLAAIFLLRTLLTLPVLSAGAWVLTSGS